jgi:hypothetical protein
MRHRNIQAACLQTIYRLVLLFNRETALFNFNRKANHTSVCSTKYNTLGYLVSDVRILLRTQIRLLKFSLVTESFLML